MKISFATLKTKIKKLLWPSGEASTLVESHDLFFVEAMVELQTWVKCLEQQNVSKFPACSTWLLCGMSFVSAPVGKIRKVYTIANDKWCNYVVYTPADFCKLQCWSKNLLTFENPENIGLPVKSLGVKFFESSADSTCGRSRTGIWAIDRRRLYLAPWIQSNETIVVEWDGKKEEWSDTDEIETKWWDVRVQKAIRLYVKWRHAQEYECPDDRQKIQALKKDFDDALADAIYDCREKITRPQSDDCQCDDQRSPTAEEIESETVPDAGDPFETHVIGVIGAYGTDDEDELNVSELVKGWSPNGIVTTGWNSGFVGGPTLEHFDERVGKYYSDYIGNYAGIYGTGATENKFWPALGRRDQDGEGLAAYQEYFTLPNNERYYDFIIGNVHFFILNSGFNSASENTEEDGNGPASDQAGWLAAKLALSTATWKVVVISDPPYSTDASFPSNATMQWPFKDWGADMVLSGLIGFYERTIVDEFPYLTVGASGSFEGTPEEPLAGTQFRSTSRGALRLTATCETLLAEYIDVDGEVLDSQELEKETE